MVEIRRARPGELDVVEALLSRAGLPVEGVREASMRLWVAAEANGPVGAIGLEPHGEHALLRSAVIAPEWRRRGLGGQLIRRLLDEAAAEGFRSVLLLTTTAADYFPRFGFHPIPRDQAPAAVRQSAEFRDLCPATAVVMRLELSTRPDPL